MHLQSFKVRLTFFLLSCYLTLNSMHVITYCHDELDLVMLPMLIQLFELYSQSTFLEFHVLVQIWQANQIEIAYHGHWMSIILLHCSRLSMLARLISLSKVDNCVC